MKWVYILNLATCLQILAQPAPNLILNGDFENPTVANGSAGFDVFAGGTTLEGWTVGGESVDLVGDNLSAWVSWTAASGHQSIDLNGSGAGSIYQDVITYPGQTYTLSFALAANAVSTFRPFVRMQFYWDDLLVDTLSFAVILDRSSPGWTYYRYSLVAPTDGARLIFESLEAAGTEGAAIDDVVLRPVCSPLQLSCPANVTQCNDAGFCGTVVRNIDPIVTASCGATVTYSLSGSTTASGAGSASGRTFNSGLTMVTYTAVSSLGEQFDCSFTVTVLDCESPSVEAVPGTNPAGELKGPDRGTQTANGFYQLLASDNGCTGGQLQIFVKDSADGPCGGTFSAGPYASGTKVAFTQSAGIARIQPMAGEIVAHIHTRGDPVLVVSDLADNTACHTAFLPPPAKRDHIGLSDPLPREK